MASSEYPNDQARPNLEVTTMTRSGDPQAVYIESECCTSCGIPWDAAPEVFEDGEYSCVVRRQPTTATELRRVLTVFRSQDVGCIRYGGRDPRVLAILRRTGCAEYCDHADSTPTPRSHASPPSTPLATPATDAAPGWRGPLTRPHRGANRLRSLLLATALVALLTLVEGLALLSQSAPAALLRLVFGGLALALSWATSRGARSAYFALLGLLAVAAVSTFALSRVDPTQDTAALRALLLAALGGALLSCRPQLASTPPATAIDPIDP